VPALDNKGRWSLPVVAKMAQEEMNKQAPTHLTEPDLELLRNQRGCIFYHYPLADWDRLIGEEADKDNCLQVGLGIADPGADPTKPVRVVALALASRRPENPFIRVVWYPDMASRSKYGG
jgi:uncharacterized protein YciU (UPF0263 family)